MKPSVFLSISALLLSGLVSCEKEGADRYSKEIIFGISATPTKVTEVTTANLSSFYVLATQGTDTETNYWGSQATAVKSGDDYLTGKYWDNDGDPSLHFYASN